MALNHRIDHIRGGYHRPRSHHAEAAAIFNTPKRFLKNSYLLVVRAVKKDIVNLYGSKLVYYHDNERGTRISKPCKKCEELIIKHGLKVAYYSI